MHVFRQNVMVSRAAIAAGTLALASALSAPVYAEGSETPAASAKAPVLTPAEPKDSPQAQSSRNVEGNPCFTGKGSIKEVLDGCAAFIASGTKDTDKLIAAHGNRAIGLFGDRRPRRSACRDG